MVKIPVLYIIIPCFNEEKVLPITAPLFLGKLKSLFGERKIHEDSRVLFVDDGSTDSTWDIIKKLSEDHFFIGIRQSRNRGHQNAVLAGLMESKKYCDITITIDCDGQDDINSIDLMIDEYLNGCEVVYGVRKERDSDTFLKRFTAESFYKILNRMGTSVVYNHADYRLVSSRVLDELENFKEVNIFLRGMIPLVGFKSTAVYYERRERLAGKSHYSLGKMLTLAVDGITSLSIKPIRMITGMGIFVSLISFLILIWIFVCYWRDNIVQGWASTCTIICFIGGIQLVCLGVIGEYVGKIYLETKGRPRYIISERTYEPQMSENRKERKNVKRKKMV